MFMGPIHLSPSFISKCLEIFWVYFPLCFLASPNILSIALDYERHLLKITGSFFPDMFIGTDQKKDKVILIY